MRLNPTPFKATQAIPEPAEDTALADLAGQARAGSNLEGVSSPTAPEPLLAVAIDIYRSSTDRSKYLSVAAGADIASMAFPADMDSDLHSVAPYKSNVEIQAGRPAVGLDVGEILRQLGRQGFAIHGLEFSASLSVGVGLGQPR